MNDVNDMSNLSLSMKEDWNAYVNAPIKKQPEQLSPKQLANLSETERRTYDRHRNRWHANLGPFPTPQLLELHNDLWDIVDSDDQDGDLVKSTVAIDALPGLGKTTAVHRFARQFQLREVREGGELTNEGHEHIPVCKIGLDGNTSIKDLNWKLLNFFGHPGAKRGTTTEFGRRALDCVLSCKVRLLILDDLHFLRRGHSSSLEVSNHLKWISNEFPVTIIVIGVGLAESGLITENGIHPAMAQTGRRTTSLTMEPFDISPGERQVQTIEDWRQLMLTIEERLILAQKFPGMITDELSDYLFIRSGGRIGSLMTLIRRGCQRAIRQKKERISRELLDAVKIDNSAEEHREELEAAFQAGKLTTKAHRLKNKRNV